MGNNEGSKVQEVLYSHLITMGKNASFDDLDSLRDKEEGEESSSPSSQPLPKEDLIKGAMFEGMSANGWMSETRDKKENDPLFLTLWYEGEVCCLFGDSGCGKSLLAVQMGEQIAQAGHTVAYFDFELGDMQFSKRYRSEDDRSDEHKFPSSFYRFQVSRYVIIENESAILKEIEKMALAIQADVVIVDNLTWLCLNAEKGDAAGRLMEKLVEFKRNHDWSLCVVSHTPKRDLSTPITQNSLAGSKRLTNMFDTTFAIGRSTVSKSTRYVKQTKVRNGEESYGDDSVIPANVGRYGNRVQIFLVLDRTEEESLHLKQPTSEEKKKKREEQAENVKTLAAKGCSVRSIANQLGMSKSAVERLLKDY